MTGVTDPLVLDLVEWIGRKPRAYAEVMEAWRTSCPRLPVWSGPDTKIKGVPAGNELSNNARVIAEQAARVAGFKYRLGRQGTAAAAPTADGPLRP